MWSPSNRYLFQTVSISHFEEGHHYVAFVSQNLVQGNMLQETTPIVLGEMKAINHGFFMSIMGFSCRCSFESSFSTDPFCLLRVHRGSSCYSDRLDTCAARARYDGAAQDVRRRASPRPARDRSPTSRTLSGKRRRERVGGREVGGR